MGAVYALFSSGLTLIWGMMNVVNFAHGDFVMLALMLRYAAFRAFTANFVSLPETLVGGTFDLYGLRIESSCLLGDAPWPLNRCCGPPASSSSTTGVQHKLRRVRALIPAASR